jgi:1-deoxy-D-xylulose-5-phosphate synthase
MTELPIGRGVLVRPGQRVAILNFGALFEQAMAAGEELDATVADMRWVKPLDTEMILDLAGSHEMIITLEENSVAGGAGSAVAEFLSSEGIDCPIRHFGIPDEFIEHGGQEEIRSSCGMTADSIIRCARLPEHHLREKQGTPQLVGA